MNTARYHGHVDAIDNGELYGWALNIDHPNEPVVVTVLIDGVPVANATAGYYRPDVATALNCSGRNGFYFNLDSLQTNLDFSLVEIQFPDGSLAAGGPIPLPTAMRPSLERRDTLLFMHIPKTAGTAFREVVARNYKQSQMLCIYGDPPGFPSTYLGDIPLQQRARLQLVFGHFGYGIHCHMPQPCHYAALIREPGKRVWSHYLHLLREAHPAVFLQGQSQDMPFQDIQDVLEQQASVHLDNLYVRTFCGLEEASLKPGAVNEEVYALARHNMQSSNLFVRKQDDLVGAYNSFAALFNWIPGLPCRSLNCAPASSQLPTDRQQRAIQNWNRWDYRLYTDMLALGILT